jgi:tRNA U55 pseudouridine synthase TruB
MLVHVTRFTSVQAEVKRQVEEELRRITRRLRLGEGAGTDTVMSHLRRLWEEDFVAATEGVIEEVEDPAITILSWEDVEIHIPQAAEDIRVMAINGTSGDALAYENSRETGLNVIVIGGDKLSRGLTLENLTVSYFSEHRACTTH